MGFDSKSYKAFRIVIKHWIIPSNIERKRKSANKIARWWIRISGSYRGFKLCTPYLELTESFPPGLWRQSNRCINFKKINNTKFCRKYYKRWARKKTLDAIKTLHIQKYSERNDEIPIHVLYSQFGHNDMEMYCNSGWLYDRNFICACNLMPENVIINYKEKYGSMEHIYRIMAQDTITSRTRSQVSMYIQNRLRSNPN